MNRNLLMAGLFLALSAAPLVTFTARAADEPF